MRVFVTGATGFIGSAILDELFADGHDIIGLARSSESERKLLAGGVKIHEGSLNDPESLKRRAQKADAVIHTAFNHNFAQFKQNCEQDRRAIAALGSGLVGSNKPLIVTSAIGILPQGQMVSEMTQPVAGAEAHPRAATEEAAKQLITDGVNVSVIRLPPAVHGVGDHGFVSILIDIARQTGISVYAGKGDNLWPAVHRLDAARLFALTITGSRPSIYHAVAEMGVVFKDIAAVIAKQLNIPLIGLSSDEAAQHFGWFSHFAAMNLSASSVFSQKALNWTPKHPGVVEDIDRFYRFPECNNSLSTNDAHTITEA